LNLSDTSRPEARILLAALHCSGRQGDRETRTGITARDDVRAGRVDWSELLWLARRERAEVRLHRWLKSVPCTQVPAAIMRMADRLAGFEIERAASLRASVARLCDTLAAGGPRPVLLDGTALAAGAAHADAPVEFVAILVADDAWEAWHRLRARGWRVPNGHVDAPRTSPSRLPPLGDPVNPAVAIALRNEPIDPGLPFTFDAARLRQWSRACPATDVRASLPHPAHAAIRSAIEFAWTRQFEAGAWRAFLDVSRIFRAPVDVETMTREAHAARARTALYWLLRLARELAEIDIPASLLSSLAPPHAAPTLRLIERHLATLSLQPRAARRLPDGILRRFWEMALAPDLCGLGRSRPWESVERPAASIPLTAAPVLSFG
jgi:hypothetical protein